VKLLVATRSAGKQREVVAWGGEAVVIPLTPGQSTTSIIEKLSERKE
jgi:bifunctional ADP-heptose synthase (sugar kinase/adenylyltransferase)